MSMHEPSRDPRKVGMSEGLRISHPSFKSWRRVLAPLPVMLEMLAFMSASMTRGWRLPALSLYKLRSCFKKVWSSNLPRNGELERGGTYAVTRVKERCKDLIVVAVASMNPSKVRVWRAVTSGDGDLPTQMPPAMLRVPAVVRTRDGRYEHVLNVGMGGAANGVLISARAIMSSFSSSAV